MTAKVLLFGQVSMSPRDITAFCRPLPESGDNVILPASLNVRLFLYYHETILILQLIIFRISNIGYEIMTTTKNYVCNKRKMTNQC